MAQKKINIKLSAIATSASSATFTLASFDVSALPGGIGNWTDGTLSIRATVTMFMRAGALYAADWTVAATIRRDGSGNPAVFSVTTLHQGGGTVTPADVSIDNSGSTVRIQATPYDTSAADWFCIVDIIGAQYA